MNALVALGNGFLSLLYPPSCLTCRTIGTTSCFCDACAQQIISVAAPSCPRCGLSSRRSGCSHCRKRVPAFTRARAMGAYDGVLSQAIHLFKYRGRPQMAEPLGVLLASYARSQSSALHGLKFDAVIPVPMHPSRQRVRGYNQSERLAQVVARELGLPLMPDALRRIRNTRPQVGLTGAERAANLETAFAIHHPDAVSGKTLLLIDDVSTTGSTLHECAKVLEADGARNVYALTLAAG